MSFNPNIPVVTDQILQSFSQMRANFQSIYNAYATNHVKLDSDQENAGMHNVLTLRPQSDPVTAANQVAIYNKLVGGIPQLFYAPNSAQTPIQMTYSSIKADSSNTQYSFVAGPFVIYGGFISSPTSGTVVTLTPGSTLLYADITVANMKIQTIFIPLAIPTNLTGNSFTITYQGTFLPGSFDIYYFAIGN